MFFSIFFFPFAFSRHLFFLFYFGTEIIILAAEPAVNLFRYQNNEYFMSCLRSKLPFTASEKGGGERKGELKKTYQLFYPTFLKTEIYTLPNELIKPEIQNAYTSSTQSGNRDTRGGRSHGCGLLPSSARRWSWQDSTRSWDPGKPCRFLLR